jgi:hypothetical protein
MSKLYLALLGLVVFLYGVVSNPRPTPLAIKIDAALTQHSKTKDCGCTYSEVPKGLLGSPCTCNPTGQTPCVCGGPDYGPDVEITRGK